MCIFFFPNPTKLSNKASLLFLKTDFENLTKLRNKLAKYIARKKDKLDSKVLEEYQELLDELNEIL